MNSRVGREGVVVSLLFEARGMGAQSRAESAMKTRFSLIAGNVLLICVGFM